MSDPAIKLFGKTIPFADTASATNDENSKKNKNQRQRLQEDEESTDVEQKEFDDNNNDNKDTSEETLKETKQEDAAILPVTSDECTNADTVSMVNEDSKTPPTDKDNAPEKNTKPEEEQSETSTSQQKTLKKPDKKLPCPRCNSMDTKFCYYNNYNVNQPRHFCKNCQRYWTDGGTMRNVPVGAGRRKNKNLASQFRHITVPEALQNAQTTLQNGMHHPSLKTNGTVLTFGSDTPLCESMASVLNLAEKSTTNYTQNGFQAPEELRISSSYGGGESSSENSNGSTVSATNTKDDKVKTGLQDPVIQNGQGFTPPIACFPGAPWPYPWNSAQWAPPLGPPAVCPPGYPMPFYPAAAYWGCSVPAAWNFSWVPQPCSPKLSTTGSAPNSPTLGKHSRDENVSKASGSGGQEPTKESNTERSLWIPKTLRIDDPGDAAKSSIWTTLGIKNEQTEPISSGGLFKAFQSKNDEKNPVSETSPLLQANPAALSRSVNFHESS